MEIAFQINGKSLGADLSAPIDISIPVTGAKAQLTVYGVPGAQFAPLQSGDFTGSVAAGAGANCETIRFTPHCHGTHTEGVGHITQRRIPVGAILKDTMIPATLVSITPENGEITVAHIDAALNTAKDGFLSGLIIRTLPNEDSKKTRNYDDHTPPYLTPDAMALIVQKGVTHLLVDMPSVDPLHDNGALAAHHIYWDVPAKTHDAATPSPRTITELIYVPDEIQDGPYLLNLQVAAIDSDAAPSRPLLFRIKTP